MHRWLVLQAAALIAGFCAGCGDGGSASTGFRIAVIPKGTSHDFWNNVQAGAVRADEEFDDVQITWKGPQSESEVSTQIEIVEGFIADGFDAICLAPTDARALRKPVEEAMSQGIPVLIYDSNLADDEGTISYVASDNYQGGVLAAKYLAELLDGSGKIILMRYQIGSESTEQREKGFTDTIAKDYPNITYLSNDQYGGTDEDAAVELGEQLLSSYGEEVDGIFCPNESTASGMLIALRRDPRGLAGKVKFVGFDGGQNLITGLEEEVLHGTVLQDPVQMGYEAVRLMREHLHKRDVPKRHPTRVHVAKHDALDDTTTATLLRPREE